MEHEKEEIEKHLEQGRKLLLRKKRKCTDNERILTLLECGLKERPLDRDFFEKIRERFENELDDLKRIEEGVRMITSIKEKMKQVERGED